MSWQFKFSQRRIDSTEYRQVYKRWVCSGRKGAQPISPATITHKEAQLIRAKVERHYGTEKSL